MSDTRDLLSVKGITKSFFGVPVLKDLGFALGPGRILGLVGENGAGKSTLMNVLGGVIPPDAGEMRFGSAVYAPASAADAREAGIGFVHQELNLFPNLTVAENLFITCLPTSGPLVSRCALAQRATELLQRVGLRVPGDTLVERLSAGERQLVEIAHALSFDARLIILDEPTTSLSARECERLFALMRQLRDDGRSLIFISHALGDVLRIADEILVLRDGAVVKHGRADAFTHAGLVAAMVGRELKQLYPERRAEARDAAAQARVADTTPVLEVKAVSQPRTVHEISLKLFPGEILGISGLMGAGRTELARIIFGLDPHASGELRLDGTVLSGGPVERIRDGMAFLTESRRSDGLCMEASVSDNISLVSLRSHAHGPLRLLNHRALATALARIRQAVRLQPSVQANQPVRTLSGGNQQKVVLAKWLQEKPKVLILDEPTRGIDVGAKFEIYQLIIDLADAGAGVLLISSEVEELLGLCDRILVMSRGEITAEFSRAHFDRVQVLQAALAGHDSREAGV